MIASSAARPGTEGRAGQVGERLWAMSERIAVAYLLSTY